MDRGPMWAAVPGVAKNQTQLPQLSTHTHTHTHTQITNRKRQGVIGDCWAFTDSVEKVLKR